MERHEALHFRDAFRDARSRALRDAEAFDALLFTLEQLGRFLHGKPGNLGAYTTAINELALQSPLAERVPGRWRALHTPFATLYTQLRRARNAAFHEGAFARHITTDAVNIAIILEDALMNSVEQIGDYMVRSPLCAFMWQPLSFVRQTLLANSFSFMPVNMASEDNPTWGLISDFALAACLRGVDRDERERRLALPLREALSLELLKLSQPSTCTADTPASTALTSCQGQPVLVIDPSGRLLGIATPFDLL